MVHDSTGLGEVSRLHSGTLVRVFLPMKFLRENDPMYSTESTVDGEVSRLHLCTLHGVVL